MLYMIVDPGLLDEWISKWSDIVRFEVYPCSHQRKPHRRSSAFTLFHMLPDVRACAVNVGEAIHAR